jgi:putative transposase
MKNHVHLSLKASEKTDISKLMQGVALSYNHYQRKRRHFVGHLWQGRFKSHIVADDNYLLTLGLYIEKNPVKAGIAENPMDYRWSSYRYYALGEKDPLVDPNPLYETLGKTAKERQSAYQDMMEARIMEEKERK